jgi:hypothetical protein|tara:strand:+ start:1588 stop:2610 length:1023 start_codon:yes stop_codon:yes gene_type:complete
MNVDEAYISWIKQLRKKQKLSLAYEMPDLVEPGQVVSNAEAAFFKDNGFIVKKGLLDPVKLASAVDKVWSHQLAKMPEIADAGWQLIRHDKETWVNPKWLAMKPHPNSGPYQGRWPIEHYGRTEKLHDIGNEDYLLDLLPNDDSVLAVAQTLLGDDLRPSTQTRGVYAIFPTHDPADPSGSKRLNGASLGPHLDQVCQQLNVCAYLDDVAPRNGGFTVYPGSHRIMFQAHEYEANWSPLPSYRDAMQQVIENIEPVELVSSKGSVIFWHGRMVHSPGLHVGGDIRWALITDFTQNRAVLSDEEHKQVGQYEWFKNAKLFREDWPITDDLWRSWKIGQRHS